MKKYIFLTLIAFLSYGTSLATIKYVTTSGSGTEDGSSWANASDSTSLKTVLDGSSAGDTIWVAKGTYKPGTSRTNYFEIKDGVKVFGGFVGNEPVGYNLASRDFATNETILSGDIGTSGQSSDNSYHVVYTQNVSTATLVDGFTIQDGNASNGSPFPEDRGGGWFNTGRGSGNSSNPIIRNIIFKNNAALLKGGALCNDGYQGITSPTISNCVFDGNSVSSTAADAGGGAIYNEGLEGEANPVITNCVFKNNSVSSRGGALFNNGSGNSGESSPVLSNVEFSNNSAESGGAIYNEGKFDMLSTNSKFNGNSAINSGGAVYNNEKGSESSVKLINCIISNNTADLGGAFNNYSVGEGFFPGFLTLRLTNCTFYDNSATTQGGVIYSSKGTNGNVSNIIRNSIFWANPTVFNNNNTTINISHSIVEVADCAALGTSSNGGVSCEAGMLFSTAVDYPQFADASNGNFQLMLSSPAINRGDNTVITDTLDFAGNKRKVSIAVDIGAFENQTDLSKYYVKENATGSNNGTSWTNAFTDLQDALQGAIPKDTIWVAAGTYKPTSTSDRTISFVIPDSVKVYGGFAGSEATNSNLDLRDFVINETILSGKINTSDSSYHVVYTKNVSQETVMDGFTIREGNANGSFPKDGGGGWYNDGSGSGNNSNPTLTNCTFASNTAFFGGAMYNDGANEGTSNPTLTNCTFTSNTASDFGGAMFNNGFDGGTSSPTLTNCIFTSNTASDFGGAIYNDGYQGSSSPILSNCTFVSNTASFYGGAMYNDGFFYGESSPTLTNCTFTSNTANGDGGAIFWTGDFGDVSSQLTNCIFNANGKEHLYYNDGDANKQPTFTNCTFYGATTSVILTVFDNGQTPVDFTNCIFWGNNGDIASDDADVNITYSIVEEAAFTGVGNINQDPLFVDAPNGNFQLVAGSPAINTGDNTAVTVPTDLAGRSRIKSSTVDMGAYESSGKMYVDSSKTTAANNGSSWTDAYIDLQDALAIAGPSDTIWVAKGTYKPTNTSDRTISFVIPDSVKVYGGFAGSEATNYNLDLRDFVINETILSGDIGTPADSTDNTNNVVFTKNVSPETVMDGFTIREGNANGPSSNNRGGGWYNDGSGSGNSSNPTLTNCTFTSNTAAFGGAMYNNGENGTSNPTLTNCTFTSNTAAFGGAMYNLGKSGASSPTLTNCTFTSNTASFDGGAMFNYGIEGFSNPTLTNCTFTSNTASAVGGAMYNYGAFGTSNPTLTNCTFASNTAFFGGAMFNNGEEGTSNPTLTNCTFTSNTASGNGGAMYNYGWDGASSPTLTNCTFTSNTANSDGGAMYNDGYFGASSPTLTNCTFTSNTASDNGGAMYNDGSGPGEGFEGSSNPILTNCILWGNIANATPNSFYNISGSVTISYSLVQEANCAALNVGNGSTVNCSGTMLYNQDPQFIDAANGILNLRCDSPARDAGSSMSAPTQDITGFTRVGNPDMGAYEFGHAEVENDIASGANPILNGTPYIKASSKILNTNNALYQGARFVEMLPGFEVVPNMYGPTVFRAEVGGACP